MTRETKVGLLVGMGVILLIGIIVSDQLSHIQREESANLTNYASDTQQGINPADTSAATADRTPAHQPKVIVPAEATAPPPSPDRPQVHESGRDFADLIAGRIAQARRDQGREPIVKRTFEETVIPVNINRLPPAPTAIRLVKPKPTLHTVASGDSLYRIAERYLGDGNRWREIAKANRDKVADDGQVRTGVTLTIPVETTTLLPAATPTRIAPPPPAPAPTRTYTVKAGDSLYSIAREKMGDGSAWKKLHDANRNTLKNPNNLKVGQTLNIPS